MDRNGTLEFSEFSAFMSSCEVTREKAVQSDIAEGLRRAHELAGDGDEDERRDNLAQYPISLVVEGEAFAVLYPDVDEVKREREAKRAAGGDGAPVAQRSLAPRAIAGRRSGGGGRGEEEEQQKAAAQRSAAAAAAAAAAVGGWWWWWWWW